MRRRIAQLRLQRRQRSNHLLSRKRHTNDACRGREDLIKDASKALRRRRTRLHAGIDPRLPRSAVRVPRVHQHRPHAPARSCQMPPPHRHRRRNHLVLRKHRRAIRAFGRHRSGQIQLPTGLDPSLHRTPHETLRQRLDRHHLLTLHTLYSINTLPPPLSSFAAGGGPAFVFAFAVAFVFAFTSSSAPKTASFRPKPLTAAQGRNPLLHPYPPATTTPQKR